MEDFEMKKAEKKDKQKKVKQKQYNVKEKLYFIILGMGGAGKSYLCNRILNKRDPSFKVASGGTPVTTEISMDSVALGKEGNEDEIKGKEGDEDEIAGKEGDEDYIALDSEEEEEATIITVVDTPGVAGNSTDKKIIEILDKCTTYFTEGIDHIFICFQIGPRITKEVEQSFKLITDLFGEKALDWMTIVFTHGNDLDEGQTKETYLKTLSETFRAYLDKIQNRCIIVDNKNDNVQQIVLDYIKEFKEKNPVKLLNARSKTSFINMTGSTINIGICHVGPVSWMNGLKINHLWECAVIPGLYTIKITSNHDDPEGFTYKGAILKPGFFALGAMTIPVAATITGLAVSGYFVAHLIVYGTLAKAGVASISAIGPYAVAGAVPVVGEYSRIGCSLGGIERIFEIRGGYRKIKIKIGDGDKEEEKLVGSDPFMLIERRGEERRVYRNDSRPITKALQYLLLYHFSSQRRKLPSVNGKYTKEWVGLVKEFQKDKGLSENGEVDKSTLFQIFTKMEIKETFKDLRVEALQTLLVYKWESNSLKKWYWENIWGEFSTYTKRALVEFQRSVMNGLFEYENPWEPFLEKFIPVNAETLGKTSDYTWAALFGHCDTWFEECDDFVQ